MNNISKWWRRNGEDLFLYSFLFALVALLFYLAAMAIVTNNQTNICLQHGYPDSKTTFQFVGYCIRTVNQTQYVVPLTELLGK